MQKLLTSAVILLAAVSAQSAAADDFDRKAVRGEIYCFPAKFATELVEKLASADADKKDVVDSKLAPRFRIFDGGGLPQNYFIRPKEAEGETGTPLTILPDGRVPDFLTKVKTAPADSDLCIKDITRVGRPGNDEGLYFEMGLTPKFKNRSGNYTLEELKEGTKDGKDLLKRMLPAVARMFMPDTDHLSLRYDAIDTPPQITAFKGRQALPPIPTEFYNESHVFYLGELKDMGADRLVIAGGAYQLSPVPSVKTMRKYGIGEKNVTTKEASNVE